MQIGKGKKSKNNRRMIKYNIGVSNPESHILEIVMEFASEGEAETVCLPVWRPGRYELGNFAKNILRLRAEDEKGELLEVSKVAKSQWKIERSARRTTRLIYQYYAFQMDAGNSWVHEGLWYINPVNCFMYLPERIDEDVEIDMALPQGYLIACSLEKKDNRLYALSYYEVADAPLIASLSLNKLTFEEGGVRFHLWQQGETDVSPEKMIDDFAHFTRAQMALFGDLPTKEYHFLFHFLPYHAYHGVEHANSTVVTLGPCTGEHSDEFYENLMGISSHELFHAWNIARIRPHELFPYDFSRENYFETGYVAEGFTTYYGDLMLLRGGVYAEEWYFKELNKLLDRHFQNIGRFNLSLAASSFDLWLDGYQAGIPNRKVSIYVKGAVVALMLDWTIRLESLGKHSLDDLMKLLWREYGKKRIGYRKGDIQQLAEELSGADLSAFFEQFVDGNTPVETELGRLAGAFGLRLVIKFPESEFERDLGFRVKREKERLIISHVHPASSAFTQLSVEDEVVQVNGEATTEAFSLAAGRSNTLVIKRGHRIFSVEVPANGRFYESWRFEKNVSAAAIENKRLQDWIVGEKKN